MRRPSRREFLQRLTLATAGGALAPLARAMTEPVAGACAYNGSTAGFGPLAPRLARNAADLTSTVVGDLSRVPLLELPHGFAYHALSLTGEIMSDGVRVPANHDGMHCFAGPAGTLVLVRNHELVPGERHFGSVAGALPPNAKVWDPFRLPPGAGGGGTTTLRLDGEGHLLAHHVSLGGTVRNCGGGATPWGSWLSCEEFVATPRQLPVLTRRHGYVFEVPSAIEEAVEPVPLLAAGRFNHEAAACDPRNGRIYLTEDANDSVLYRFVPRVQPRAFGDLQRGGELQALRLAPDALAVCDGSGLPATTAGGVDTRRRMGAFLGQPLPVEWVPIGEPDPPDDTVRAEAARAGAALFARGEGAWFADGLVYFVCTSGGDAGRGQIWSHDPLAETLTLRIESPGSSILDQPDNITVAADGALYLMEDGAGGNRVVGVTPAGELFPFLRNAIRRPDRGGRADGSEFAGGCFSPDGRLFFVNTQGIGITLAVFRDDGAPIAVSAVGVTPG